MSGGLLKIGKSTDGCKNKNTYNSISIATSNTKVFVVHEQVKFSSWPKKQEFEEKLLDAD